MSVKLQVPVNAIYPPFEDLIGRPEEMSPEEYLRTAPERLKMFLDQAGGMPRGLANELEETRDERARYVRDALAHDAAMLRDLRQSLPGDRTPLPRVVAAHSRAQRRFITRLVALGVTDSHPRVIAYVGDQLKRYVVAAEFASFVEHAKSDLEVDPATLATAAAAAVNDHLKGRLNGDAMQTLREWGFGNSADYASLHAATARLRADLQLIEERGGSSIERATRLGLSMLARLPGDEERAGARYLVGPLVAFAASSRGTSDPEYRADGVAELLRVFTPDTNPSDLACMGALEVFRHSRRLLADERHAWKSADGKWADIARTVQIETQRMRAPYVFDVAGELRATQSRALYYHAAVDAGVPLALLLRELHDSSDLTFGPKERELFTSICLYGARRYAANLAADNSKHVAELAEREERIADLRATLRMIERSIRGWRDILDDENLLGLAKARVRRALQEGHLRRREADSLLARSVANPGAALLEEMITRARAGQDVLAFTATLRDGKRSIPFDLLRGYSDLPHVRRYAVATEPGLSPSEIMVPSGQTLQALERTTRERWVQHRARAAEGKDVHDIKLGADDERETFQGLSRDLVDSRRTRTSRAQARSARPFRSAPKSSKQSRQEGNTSSGRRPSR